MITDDYYDIVEKLTAKAVSYIGQTSRCLKTRISEHRNHINRNIMQNS